jgi:calcineurin-like phosphoesterase family protein
MIYFISDTHFNHNNILKYTNRHLLYENVAEMNKSLVENINSVVTKKDTLYHLGDFCMDKNIHWLKKTNEILDHLKCKNVHLILGNHDPKPTSEYLKKAKFKSVNTYLELNYKKYGMCLSHYPLHTWNKSCPINLHGHCHGKLGFITSPRQNDFMRFDIGVDSESLNYKPIAIERLLELYNLHK